MDSFPTAPHHSNKKDVEKLTRVADYSRGPARRGWESWAYSAQKRDGFRATVRSL